MKLEDARYDGLSQSSKYTIPGMSMNLLKTDGTLPKIGHGSDNTGKEGGNRKCTGN